MIPLSTATLAHSLNLVIHLDAGLICAREVGGSDLLLGNDAESALIRLCSFAVRCGCGAEA